MAPTRSEANAAYKRFLKRYGPKYPKATEKLRKDRDVLLAFYNFPAEHWVHLRTTNPIESTCATVCHRTRWTKNCFSRTTFLGLGAGLQAFGGSGQILATDPLTRQDRGAARGDGL